MLRKAPLAVGLVCLVLIALLYTRREPPDLSFLSAFSWGNFKTMFLSIILESIPFVLLGVLVSALLQVFVSERTVRRWIPRHPVPGVLFACLLGVVFPLCECGMIPVVRRLMRKGMPLYIAVVFILAGPVLNPVVYASTYMAFRSRPEIAYSRMGLAFCVAVAVGLFLYAFVKKSPLLPERSHDHGSPHHRGLHQEHDHHDHHHDHHADRRDRGRPSGNRLLSTLSHASDEFFEMGKYLIIGAMLTAGIQTVVARESLAAIGQGEWSSHLFMMGFAYLLSLCSTSDAFVASSFATTFSAGSLLTFLVFGPMLDLKNTFMLLSVFRARFVLLLGFIVAAAVLVGSRLFESLYLG